MTERAEIIGELKHLVRYHVQACTEFFDDIQTELAERVQILTRCLEAGSGTLEEIRGCISLLTAAQEDLKKRIGDLDYLTSRMLKLVSQERPLTESGGSKPDG